MSNDIPLGYWLSRGEALAIKAFGGRINPATAWFHGFTRKDTGFDLDPSDEGMVRAFLASLWSYRCITTRGKRLSSIPLVVKTLDDQYIDARGKVVPERVSSTANQHVLQRLVGPKFKRDLRYLEYDICIWGRGFVEPTIKNLFRLNPSTMEVRKDPEVGLLGYRQSISGRHVAEWEPHELLYFYDYDPTDDFNGLSPLSFALRAVGAEVNIGDFVESYFANDATPAGLLTTDQPLQPPEADRAVAWWEKLFKGPRKKGKVGIASNGLHFEPISSTLEDMALADLRLEVRREVTAAFGVPMTIALADEAANFSTSKEQHIAFYTETLIPELEMILDTLNEHLAPRFGDNLKIIGELSGIEVLQEAKNEVANRAFAGFQAGVNTLNEARQLVGLPPVAQQPDGPQEDYLNVPNVGLVRITDLPKLADRALQAPEAAGGMGLEYGDGGAEPTDAAAHDTVTEDGGPTGEIEKEADLPDEPNSGGRPATAALARRPGLFTSSSMRAAGAMLWDDAIKSAALSDLARWRKKALAKKATAPFKSSLIPSAIQGFLKWDLETAAGDAEGIKSAFNAAKAQLESADPTPEEFQEYWDGIDDVTGGLVEQLGALVNDPAVIRKVAERLEETSDIEMALAVFDELADAWADQLVGDEQQPGVLTAIMMAGAARGQQLHNKVQRQTAPAPVRAATVAIPVSWQLLGKDARDYARRYSYDLVRGINQTTSQAFREAMKDWIEKGGSLPGLTDLLLGRLRGLDIPQGWSKDKIDWATSRDRARLIAQTESTRAFNEGNVRRWKQLGVAEIRWRTQNARDVCPHCKGLNNVVAQVTKGWNVPALSIFNLLRPPLHPGCRCFTAPVVASRVRPLEKISPRVTQQQAHLVRKRTTVRRRRRTE